MRNNNPESISPLQQKTYIFAVRITRVVDDDSLPTFVACEFEDAWQRKLDFVEKPQVISCKCDQTFPPDMGYIACKIVRELTNASGDHLIEVDNTLPWGIASLEDETKFVILSSNLIPT